MGLQHCSVLAGTLALLSGISCGPSPEGHLPGECTDGADNDEDGLFDCGDPDCFGSPDCSEGDTDTDADSDTDSDSDADADTDADADADTDTDTDANGEGGGGAEFLDDELAGGGGDDGWRPSASLVIDCPWLPQVPPGDWNNTLNCGPTSLVMAEACLDATTPDEDDIVDIIEWMDVAITTYGGTGSDNNGSYTNTQQLADTTSSYYGRTAERFTGWSLEDIYDELEAGLPVVVATYTQTGNDYPSDEMLSGAGHFMLMVGLTPTHVVLHDPGRSAAINAEYREFTIESFYQYWQGQAGVAFDADPVNVDGQLDSCEVDGTTLYVTGSVSADVPIEKWSITISSSSALAYGYPEDTYDEVDVEIDVSDYEGAGTQTAALWVRPDGGTAETVDTCEFEVECEDESYYQCPTEGTGYDVYWYDSCGNRGSVKEYCSSSENCVNTSSTTASCDVNCGNGSVDSGEDCDGSDLDGETCSSLGYDSGSLSCDSSCSFDETACCNDESYYQCPTEGSGYDVYWYDDCGNRGSVKENCSSSESCVNTSSTTATCDANCGNGSVDSGEDCDGSDLDGESCTSRGYDYGSLSCSSSCTFDESGCEYYTTIDLDPGTVSVSTSSPTAGDRITVSGSIDNDGTGSSGSFTAGIYLSSNSTYSSADTELTTWTESSISGGGSGSYSESVTIPSTASGSYYILVVADPYDSVSETNEGDNTGYRSISVIPLNTATDETDSTAWCAGSIRDIFYASSISLANETSDPEVTATFRKCDGTSMTSDKDCHVRVGSYTGSSYSSSLARVSFVWSSGSSSYSTSWDAWPSSSSFSSASTGDTKEFYVICEEPTGDWNHWRSENPIVIEVQ